MVKAMKGAAEQKLLLVSNNPVTYGALLKDLILQVSQKLSCPMSHHPDTAPASR
ncbi:MAG: hypothetical protein EBR88_08435 [Betaproteobacteria bacterium]|nr:hypothetical protein [Betaproteobacteria bacterium]